MSGTTRACRGTTFARTSDTIDDAFPFFRDDERDQKRERHTRDGESVFVHAYVSRPILLPRRGNPFRRSKFVNTRKKERKKERTIRGILSSSRMTCIYLSSPRVYHRSGSFIGISFVFITGRTPRRRERLRSNSILTTTKKKKVKRNERGAKRGALL